MPPGEEGCTGKGFEENISVPFIFLLLFDTYFPDLRVSIYQILLNFFCKAISQSFPEVFLSSLKWLKEMNFMPPGEEGCTGKGFEENISVPFIFLLLFDTYFPDLRVSIYQILLNFFCKAISQSFPEVFLSSLKWLKEMNFFGTERETTQVIELNIITHESVTCCMTLIGKFFW